ncbi:hypothetical protein HYDPIDRAFT_168532 [Hydnomerulius pinastri MD-312]|uniref:Uncharacterized protein n=1 Tax=Hydnomerulius pinastri MD-312 TaxID=994086 RepID=A0A0C9WEG9_9AGAM|nr:hypothetical protein HYDPIDRAFT_168532 [Hydnomerulius pinastri MD-312]
MSDQLPENFQKLQVSDGVPKQRAKPSRRRSEAPKKPRCVPMKLKRPTQNRHMLQFYGIAVSKEWILNFDRQQMAKEYPEDADDDIIAAYTAQLLHWLTKIETLAYEPVHNPGDAPPDCLIDGNVLIISVCRNDPEGYSERPPQRNMDRLEEIIGRGPARWWVDAEEF